MTRVQLPKTMTFNRDDVEQFAYIIGRLETLLSRDDLLASQVTQFLTNETSTEWLTSWVSAIHTVLHRRLFPRPAPSVNIIQQHSNIGP